MFWNMEIEYEYDGTNAVSTFIDGVPVSLTENWLFDTPNPDL